MNIYISFLINGKAKTLTIAGEPELSPKCSTAVKRSMFPLISQWFTLLILTLIPYSWIHLAEHRKQQRRWVSCTVLTEAQAAAWGKWWSPFTWHSLEHTYNTASSSGAPSTRKVSINCSEFRWSRGRSTCSVKSSSGNWACSTREKMALEWPHSSLPVPMRRLSRKQLSFSQWCKWGLGKQQV